VLRFLCLVCSCIEAYLSAPSVKRSFFIAPRLLLRLVYKTQEITITVIIIIISISMSGIFQRVEDTLKYKLRRLRSVVKTFQFRAKTAFVNRKSVAM
jgi:hypothetical protein